jgi:co-chaperonin GroES (HSP10)
MEKELILVGDKILVEPDEGETLTDYGLYLPQTVKDKEKVQSGKVIKVGPGYPVFDPTLLEQEPWKVSKNKSKYFPLQAKEGDYCIFLRDSGIEIEFEKKKYLVVPQSAVLLLIRGKRQGNLEEII